MARIFSHVDPLPVPSLRDELLTIINFTSHPSLTLRAGFVEVSEAPSDCAPDPAHPLPKFAPPRRVRPRITLIGRPVRRGRPRTSGARYGACPQSRPASIRPVFDCWCHSRCVVTCHSKGFRGSIVRFLTSRSGEGSFGNNIVGHPEEANSIVTNSSSTYSLSDLRCSNSSLIAI